jgi:hypothetical protein
MEMLPHFLFNSPERLRKRRLDGADASKRPMRVEDRKTDARISTINDFDERRGIRRRGKISADAEKS